MSELTRSKSSGYFWDLDRGREFAAVCIRSESAGAPLSNSRACEDWFFVLWGDLVARASMCADIIFCQLVVGLDRCFIRGYPIPALLRFTALVTRVSILMGRCSAVYLFIVTVTENNDGLGSS